MTGKMKGVITVAPMTSVIREMDIPPIDDDSVLIKMKYCGVCRSEHWDWAHAEREIGFGHEPLGVIVEVGKNVTGYAVGDKVSGLWGSTLPGAGAMVQYQAANVKQSVILKLPDNVRDVDMILEPLACMFSAVSKVRADMPGTRVCVVGCGYMGCGAISLLTLRGFEVVAVDIRESSRRDALQYGAKEAYTPEEAIEKFIRQADVSNLIDAGFPVVCEWGESDESLDTAINLTKKCGLLCVGAYHTGEKRAVDMQQLGLKAIVMHNTHPREEDLSRIGAENALHMLANGDWRFRNIPTMVYPMSCFDQAQSDMEEAKYGRFMKAVIDMEAEDGEPHMAE